MCNFLNLGFVVIGGTLKQYRFKVVGQCCWWNELHHWNIIIYYIELAGHPFHGWPARLRGHKCSGLWKVWTVPSPPLPCPALPLRSPPLPSPPLPSPPLPCPALPAPPLPCPALPCPALPCPALPCPALPCPALHSLPPSLPPACQIWSSWVQPKPLFRVRPRSNLAALWITAETFGPVMTALVWRHPAAMIDCAKGQRKHFCLKSRIPRAVIGMGTNEWPSPLPEG